MTKHTGMILLYVSEKNSPTSIKFQSQNPKMLIDQDT